MKTKKALAGLLGLLGSFVAFPFLVGAFPAFVEALPFLFTESLPPYTKPHEKYQYKDIHIRLHVDIDRETETRTHTHSHTEKEKKRKKELFSSFLDLRSERP
jgi:hypothetical protein